MSEEIENRDEEGDLIISAIRKAIIPEIKVIIEGVYETNKKNHTEVMDVLDKFSKQKRYSINEVAKKLQKHHRSVRYWINIGALEADKIGSKWQISQKQLDKFLSREKNMINEEKQLSNASSQNY